MAHEELIREGEKFANRRSYCWSAGKVLVRRFVAALESSGRESASLRARVAELEALIVETAETRRSELENEAARHNDWRRLAARQVEVEAALRQTAAELAKVTAKVPAQWLDLADDDTRAALARVDELLPGWREEAP